MNLREWARATHGALADHPEDEHQRDSSMAHVELILRLSIQVLVDSLNANDDLRLDALGRLWVEKKRAYQLISNLAGKTQSFKIQSRRIARFRASTKLTSYLNRTSSATDSD